MRRRDEAVLETLRQMQVFLDANGVMLRGVNSSGARKRLDETVAKLEAHAVAQVGGRRDAEGETARLHALREQLRFEHMRPVTIIAGQFLRDQPEFTVLRMPNRKAGTISVTAAAYDMANAAEKYADLFVAEGLAPDFVVQLRAATDRLLQSIDARGQGRVQRAGATAGLKVGTSRGRALIRLLDALVRPKLGTNDALLREWQFAKHIKRSRTTESAPSATEVSPPSLVLTTAGVSPTPAPNATAG